MLNVMFHLRTLLCAVVSIAIADKESVAFGPPPQETYRRQRKRREGAGCIRYQKSGERVLAEIGRKCRIGDDMRGQVNQYGTFINPVDTTSLGFRVEV